MAYLRLGNIIGTLGRVPESILDVGYGNGSFLKVCTNIIPECYGHDISSYPVPEGCREIHNIVEGEYDVITFFDSLEHFEDIEFVKELKCKAVCISVPHCHYPDDDEWFKNWKHRRPHQHLWHFNIKSLESFMDRMGYMLLSSSNLEDTIRKNHNQKQTTSIFKKKKKVFVNGTFDLLHKGHLELLNYAKSLGDYLCVGIDTDDRVREKKGSTRPIRSQGERKLFLENLKAVDEVRFFSKDIELEDLIKSISPDTMVVGSDWEDKKVIGSQHAKEIIFFERIDGYSTTAIIKNISDR